MDRLARNLVDRRTLLREFTEAGAAVEIVREHMTYTGKDSPMQRLRLSLLGAEGPPTLADRRLGRDSEGPGCVRHLGPGMCHLPARIPAPQDGTRELP